MSVFDAKSEEPTRLYKGDYYKFKRSDLASDYPPAGHALTYTFRNDAATATTIADVVAAEVDGDYEIEFTSAITGAWPTGRIHWTATISDGTNSAVVGTGFIDLIDRTEDPREHAEIMLGKIESILENRADADVASYSIGDRSLTKLSIEELTKWRSHYKAEVARLNRKRRGLGRTQRTLVDFS